MSYTVREAVCDTVCGTACDSVRGAVCDTVCGTVRDMVCGTVRDAASGTVRDMVCGTVRDGVRDGVRSKKSAECLRSPRREIVAWVFQPRRHFTSTAFCACSLFSASSKISRECFSNTAEVISSSLCAGRQCNTMASLFATFMTLSLI